jgi:molecular chaperone DnaJ
MRVQVSCSFCSGKGSVSSESCKGCEGKGYVVDFVKTLNVKIPAGIEDENQIRLAGEAADGNDLFLIVNVEKHPIFRREDKFLVGQIEVPYSTLVLGGEVDMDLFGTKITVKISPKTKTGTKLRLKKQGMPSLQKQNLRGDLILEVVLRMPQVVTRDHEKILSRLAKIEKYN